MQSHLRTLIGRIGLTSGGHAAFGAAIGGLFGLMIVNVFGGIGVGPAAWPPGVSMLKVSVVLVVVLQVTGALVAWAAAAHRTTRR